MFTPATAALSMGATGGGSTLASIMGGLSSAGSFLGGLGQAASGLFGGGSKGPKAPSFEDVSNLQKQFAKNTVQWRVEDAKKAGIHPLAALGLPSASPNVSMIGGETGGADLGTRMAEMGQGMSRAAGAYQTNEQRQYDKAVMGLNLEGKWLENERIRSEIRLMSTGATVAPSATPAISGQGDVNDALLQLPMPLGYATGALPLHQIGINEHGQPFRMYNDKLGDNDIAQIAHFMRYTMPDSMNNAASRWWKMVARKPHMKFQFQKGGK